MMPGGHRELTVLAPWLLAALVWFGLLAPLRADRDGLLRDQARIRRDRLRAEVKAKELEGVKARVSKAFEGACRAPGDPASLRRRLVVQSRGLPLSRFALAVSGPGASIDAEGSATAVAELARAIGDPRQGLFLRSVSLTQRSGASALSAVVSPLPAAPPLKALPTLGLCGEGPPVSVAVPTPAPSASPRGPRRPAGAQAVRPSPPPATPPDLVPTPAPTPEAPPFSVVAYLMSAGRSRVTVKFGGEVKLVSPGESLAGWRCVSIDRNDGAVFESPSGARVTLVPGSSPH